jgi:hypothetical protein
MLITRGVPVERTHERYPPLSFFFFFRFSPKIEATTPIRSSDAGSYAPFYAREIVTNYFAERSSRVNNTRIFVLTFAHAIISGLHVRP